MPTEISGSTGVNKIQDNTIVNADINSSAAIAGSKLVMPTGSVLQVVQSGSISRTTFTSTNTWVDTDNELSITPSSTNSKILITAYQGSRLDGDTPIRGSYRLLRGSTAVWNTSGLSEQFQVRNAANEFNQSSTISYLDSPSTTSSVTYKIQAWLTTGTNFIAWESNYGANMILMEIAG